MRIGVNAGSLERELVEKYGFPCPPAMVESALRYIEIAESEGYHDLIVSLKSSDVMTAVEAYRLYAKQANYPTHIGITEAGKPPYAVTKSAAGLAPILLDGIGDTIRISLLGDQGRRDPGGLRHPASDAAARPQAGADRLPDLRPAGDRPGRHHGRAGKAAWAAARPPIKVSVLGCIVNGPGEAREADLGIAAGKGKGVIFKRGEIIRHVLESEMVDALIEEIDKWEIEETAAGSLPREKSIEQKRHRLPVLSK